MIARRTLMMAAPALPPAVLAQARRVARIGYLSGGEEGVRGDTIDVLTASLGERGWRIGDNLEIVYRWAGGDASSLPRLAGEILASRPDLVVATGTTETRALRVHASSIPILFMQAADPVAAGLVESVVRPGGNVTGFTTSPQLLSSKHLDLLAQITGRAPRRIAWMGNPGNVGAALQWDDARSAALWVGADAIRLDVRGASDLEGATDALRQRDALIVMYDFLMVVLRARIAALASRLRLPAIYGHRNFVLAGGLMSFGADLRENFRHGAGYVHRILNGASPRDLPVVEPSRFELVISAATARAMALTVPDSLLAQADEVIE